MSLAVRYHAKPPVAAGCTLAQCRAKAVSVTDIRYCIIIALAGPKRPALLGGGGQWCFLCTIKSPRHSRF